MLALEVSLLTGRYVATSYNDRTRPEWPPHPARLFSALVASHADTHDPSERAALEWLEALAPPHISGSEAHARDLVTVFVPVNDTTVTGLSDERQAVLETARQEVKAARGANDLKRQTKAEKALAKLEKSVSDETFKAFARAQKLSGSDLTSAPKLLPDQRGRQPRTFPSVTPYESTLIFFWPEAQPSPEQRAALDALTARVTRLGHSSTLVSIRLVDHSGTPRWRPDDAGEEKLRVTRAGQLERLDQAWERHQETESGRVMPCAFQGYSSKPLRPRQPEVHSVFGEDWIVLRRIGGPRLLSPAGVGLAKTVRAALLSLASQPPPELLTGHKERDVPTDRAHLAVVPLPWVGNPHADGALLGVALVLPRETDPADRRALFQAIAAWERSTVGEEGLPVHLGSAAEPWRVERMEERADLHNLRVDTWCRPSVRWVSVTPLALDRHPGDLHDSNAARQERAYAEAEAGVRKACLHIGLPEPIHVQVLPASPLTGSRKAKHHPPFPSEPGRTRRQLVHASLEFDAPVRGPVLLGAGRYVGLGLFRPVNDE